MPDDPRSHISLIVAKGNPATRALRDDGPRVDIEGMAEVYARAAELWGGRLAELPAGFRLFWGRRRHDLGFLDLPADTGRFAILGRHGCCDAVLDGDGDLSLRHLLATTVRLEDGTVALRVLDLRGSLPFFLDDESPRRAMVANGPVVLRLGRYVVGALPTGEGASIASPLPRPFTDPSPAPEPAIPLEIPPLVEPRSQLPPLLTSTGVAPPARSQRVRGSTHITLMPPPAEISDVADAAHDPAALEPDARPGGARLTVERGGRGASVEVSEGDLDLGLLIGRADKCMDRGVRAVLTEWISRCHILILRFGGKIHAYDLCSMTGTFKVGEKVRHAVLSDAGTVLCLGSARGVELRWHAREQAPAVS